jgi:hypothetical protein
MLSIPPHGSAPGVSKKGLSMNKRTKNHARLLHVALIELPDTLLLLIIEQRWASAHRQTRNITLSDRERLALGYRAGPSSWVAPDPQELRHLLRSFSPEEVYHIIVPLAANTFFAGFGRAQQGQRPKVDHHSGYRHFMQQLVGWLRAVAQQAEAGQAIFPPPSEQAAARPGAPETEQRRQTRRAEKEIRRQQAREMAERAQQQGYLLGPFDLPAMGQARAYFREWCQQHGRPYLSVEYRGGLLATVTADTDPVGRALEGQGRLPRGRPYPCFAPIPELQARLTLLAEEYVNRSNAHQQEVRSRWQGDRQTERVVKLKNILAVDAERAALDLLSLWPLALAEYEALRKATMTAASFKASRPAAQPEPVWMTALKRLRSEDAASSLPSLPEPAALPDQLDRLLTKAQIAAFLGLPANTRESKARLLLDLQAMLAADQPARAQFFEVFVQELAVGPGELETLLACTPSERKRWISDGKLPVLGYRAFRKAGQDLSYPVHDRRCILSLTQVEIAHWRGEHRKLVDLHRKTGAQKAQFSRKANQQARRDFFTSLEEMMCEWERCGSPQLAAALKLALWTQWASRWAKENQFKQLHAIKYQALYLERRDVWYARKNEAMAVLAQMPYARLFYYRPEEADKCSLGLCDEHYEMRRELGYENKWVFFADFGEEIRQCPRCHARVAKDYYALYHLEVEAAAFPELRFSFHVPYSIGKAFLPSPHALPRVEHTEQDGIFRFGRPLLEDEKVLYREKVVEANFALALAEAQRIWGLVGTPEETTNDALSVGREQL